MTSSPETAVSAALQTAEHRDMEASAYHAHPAIGASMLECFRGSRRTFHARYVAKTEKLPEPSDAMRLGTLVHRRLLEPERYSAELPPPMPEKAPDGLDWNMRKPAHREAWAAELGVRSGDSVDSETRAAVEAIANAVLGNWHARRLLERDGEAEYAIFWRDKETGLDCKCMVDWWSAISLDLKTTRNPEPSAFAKDCVTLGYHRKRKHYLAGMQALTGEDVPLVHLAVANDAPFVCCCYDLDDLDFNGQSLGFRQWRRTLRDLAECYASDDWSEPFERQIVSLRLPGWAFHSDDYAIL